MASVGLEDVKDWGRELDAVADLVQLRYFGGLTFSECARVLDVSPRTVDTWWAYTRAWLAIELKNG
jgi:DNA-directed RNA polymerase specialized sigma24 family protein